MKPRSRHSYQRFAKIFTESQRRRPRRRLVLGLLLGTGFALMVCSVAMALRQYARAVTQTEAGGMLRVAGMEAEAPVRNVRGAVPSPPLDDPVVEEQGPGAVRYWETLSEAGLDTFPLQAPARADHDQYVTFEDDTGGWNNIRMAFEVFVVVAKATGRVLVMPPRCRFYLLDRGPITVFERDRGKTTTSSYGDYYDLDRLKRFVRVISTEEFLEREGAALGLPEEMRDAGKPQMVSNGHHTDYFLWMRDNPHVAIWPVGPRSTADFTLDSDEPVQPSKKVIHFPMHVSRGLRYLGGVPALMRSYSPTSRTAIKRFVRVALVYGDHIFRTAEAYIRLMGGFDAYTALHIRRNELQFKKAFVTGEESAAHVLPLVGPGEKVYLATDEMSPGFFNAFAERHITIVRMSDLREQVEAEVGPIAAKYEGMVEQVVCAAARSFAGTPFSTFSAHIFRLRRYMHGAREQGCFFHTDDYSALGQLDNARTKPCSGGLAEDATMGDL